MWVAGQLLEIGMQTFSQLVVLILDLKSQCKLLCCVYGGGRQHSYTHRPTRLHKSVNRTNKHDTNKRTSQS